MINFIPEYIIPARNDIVIELPINMPTLIPSPFLIIAEIKVPKVTPVKAPTTQVSIIYPSLLPKSTCNANTKNSNNAKITSK